jgi:hypothetical protein
LASNKCGDSKKNAAHKLRDPQDKTRRQKSKPDAWRQQAFCMGKFTGYASKIAQPAVARHQITGGRRL